MAAQLINTRIRLFEHERRHSEPAVEPRSVDLDKLSVEQLERIAAGEDLLTVLLVP